MLIDYVSARMPALDVTHAALLPAMQASSRMPIAFQNNSGFVSADEIQIVNGGTNTSANGRTGSIAGRGIFAFAGISLPSANLLARINPMLSIQNFKKIEIDGIDE